MANNAPQYHVLKEPYEYLTENVWEIRLRQSENIEWQIFLSCLFSDNLHEKIKEFIDSVERVKDIPENFNPFMNRFSFSQNEALTNIVQKFKDILLVSSVEECNVIEIDSESNILTCASERNILICASKYLNSNICLFTRDMELCHKILTESISLETIILFKPINGKIKYSFGLTENYCQKWREAALKNALSKICGPKHTFKNVWKTVKKDENFLIAILKSNMKNIVEDFSNSPFIIRKLIDAGYQTDPAIKDHNGLSAFYHAGLSKNRNLCVSIYHLGIFYCTKDGLSTREPSLEVIANLNNLKKTLKDDLRILNKGYFRVHTWNFKKYRLFRSLISLKIGVNESILKIKVNDAEQNRNVKLQIEQHRDILLSILDAYSDHSKKLFPSNRHGVLKTYMDYHFYFEIVDVDISLLFFDYIFKLKKTLKLRDNMYVVAESSFFIFLLNHVIFNRKVKNSPHFKFLNNISKNHAFQIPFMVRKNQLMNIESFYYVLKDTAVDDDIVRKEVPAKEFSLILHEHEEIRNYLLIKRLLSYIESGLGITEKDNKILMVFIVERILQVIGEFIKMDPDEDFNVKWILSLYIPKNIRKLVHDLRKELSHLENNAFLIKINLEKNFILFKGILEDIKKMYEYLKPLLNVINGKLTVYIEENLLTAAKKIKNSEMFTENLQSNMQGIIQCILDIPQNLPNTSIDELFLIIVNISKNLPEYLKGKKKEYTEEESKLFKKEFPIREEKILELNEKMSMSLDKTFQPIIYFLEFMLHKFKIRVIYEQRYEMHYKYAEKILHRLNQIKNCNKQITLNLFKTHMHEYESLIKDLKKFVTRPEVSQNSAQLNEINSTKEFLKLIKTSEFVTNENKEEIKKCVFKKLENDFLRREILIESIHEGFTMNKEELERHRILYLLPEEWATFLDHYEKKNIRKTLHILETRDPIVVLENIFHKNSIKKRELDILLRRIGSSDDIREKLENFVKGSQKKIIGNRLSYLLNRIVNLEKILIDEENESLDFWGNPDLSLEQYIHSYYMEDRYIKLAIEMLVFECINLFGKKKSEWEKSCGLFQGIDLRNVIGHEDVIIQNICDWFDPMDLPKDIVRVVIDFSKDKKAIFNILALYKKAKENFGKFAEFLKLEGKEKGLVDGQNDVLEKYKKYIKLLPKAKMSLFEKEAEIERVMSDNMNDSMTQIG